MRLAVAASSTPMAIDAKPSSTGACHCTAANVPASAMAAPIRAALSSSRTMNRGGFLLSLSASKYPREPTARRNSL
jgi:hypothetical protein